MFRLKNKCSKGSFTIGKIYRSNRVTEKGHPVVIDNDGQEIDVWSEEERCLPSCWEQVTKLTKEEAQTVGIKVLKVI